MIDYLVSQGLPDLKIPNDFEEKMDKALNIIMKPNQLQYSVKNGVPMVKCASGEWIYYNSSRNGNLRSPMINNPIVQ